MIGLADFSLIEMISYIFLVAGISLWFNSFVESNKGGIFTGSFVFLSGIVLAVESSFTIWNPARMIFPSIFIISGISLLFVYMSDKNKIVFLILSLLLLAAGMFYLFDRINFKTYVFIEAVWEIILRFWFVIILIAFIIFIMAKSSNQKEDYKNSE
ncbi:Hypothetical protein IALB_0210 [Ignavibacterium album JCM 16511]|uniref:Uncharacterized protein n=1 Tax=Ignavibacterium album (strain DSM 19864 / JCM 16511 / NBRC 101810 / Mat9-16) TaxID=945713 RepID=I0AG15_IGNAJ|nr:Hypothetical protein IALB_0210 [Ignavibacterium album JCM 16511]